MEKKEVCLFGILIILSMLSLAGAVEDTGEIRPYLVSTDVDIRVFVGVNGSINGVDQVNITFYSPDKTVLIPLTAMDKNLDKNDFNFTLPRTNTTQLGVYQYVFCGYSALAIDECATNKFEITPTGTQLSTSKAIIYILLSVAVFILFMLSFYFAVVIPYSNDVDERGIAIKVTKLKYVKLGFVLISYVLFVWFLNVMIAVSGNFVELTSFFGFFGFMFQMLNRFVIPFSLFMLILMGFEVVRDINANKLMRSLGRASTGG